MHIAFLGGGNMASAMIAGLHQAGNVSRTVSVVEHHAAQRDLLTQKYGVRAFESVGQLTEPPDVWILAVKPQAMQGALSELAPVLNAAQIVISIAAGLRVQTISGWLNGHAKIVRTMPNTPALLGLGVTGVFAPADQVSDGERQTVDLILASIGQTVWVDDEAQIDAITAISGSGPAYVFNMMEHLVEAAQRFGFAPSDAKKLVVQTFIGASALAAQSDDDLATLRAKVTSKGGTTAAALATFEAMGLGQVLTQGAVAAKERARGLSEELSQSTSVSTSASSLPSSPKN